MNVSELKKELDKYQDDAQVAPHEGDHGVEPGLVFFEQKEGHRELLGIIEMGW